MEGCVAYPEEFVREYKTKGYWEDLTIGEHLTCWVEQYGERPALAYDGKDISFRQMDTYATRLAYQMIRLGIKTYDRVIFQLPNVPELVYMFYACMKIGAIPICSLISHRWSEISFFAKETEARVHVIPAGTLKDFDYEEFSDQIREGAPNLGFTFTLGKPARINHVCINDLMASQTDVIAVNKELSGYRPNPMEPAVFQLSGGTTGVPKMVPRTHNDYYYNAKCGAVALELDQNARCAMASPLIHNLALITCMLPTHSVGGTVVLIPYSSPEEILNGIEINKVTCLFTVPVFIHRLLDLTKEQINKYDIRSFNRLLWGGNPVPADVLLKFMDTFHCDSDQTYGMAEGLVNWTRKTDPLEVKLYTQGRPVSEADEIRVVDVNTGEEVMIGEVGECWTRGPYTLRGYYKAAERNKEAFTPDGFYKTGDLVRRDIDGNITIVGRVKDCISRGAEKINAEEVEGHIVKFRKVKNAAVVAMPDKIMGERACAFVVPQPGESVSLEELNRFLLNEQRIAKFKLPERLEIVDELPITKVGKFEKKSLREKIVQILSSEGKV